VAKYPDFTYRILKDIILRKFGIKNISLGNGTEDLIIRINSIVKEKGLKVSILAPIFYRVIETLDCPNVSVVHEKENLDSLQLDSDSELVWLTNPNLFSGNTYSKKSLLNLFKRYPEKMFIVDEAGMFMIRDWHELSVLNNSSEKSNFLVLSSFSKAYGLAGMRCGFATGNSDMINDLNKRGLTFPINSIAQEFLLSVLEKDHFIEEIREKVQNNKLELTELLSKYNQIEIKYTKTNCIFFRHRDGKRFFNKLVKSGIVGLYIEGDLPEKDKDYIRLTINSSDRMQQILLIRLKEALEENL
jgi:histidinol-phosphate aminotransferase